MQVQEGLREKSARKKRRRRRRRSSQEQSSHRFASAVVTRVLLKTHNTDGVSFFTNICSAALSIFLKVNSLGSPVFMGRSEWLAKVMQYNHAGKQHLHESILSLKYRCRGFFLTFPTTCFIFIHFLLLLLFFWSVLGKVLGLSRLPQHYML